MLIKQTAAESGHWYSQDGSPAYEVQAKDGTMRPTTLRDARKLGLLPSVTTVLGILAKPGLEQWKMQQTILSAMTLPRLEGESLDDFAARVILDSKAQGQAAAQLGTEIHASLDKAYSGLPYPPEHDVYVKAVQEAIFLKYGEQEWIAEASFAHHLGYGGKVDLASSAVVIDFKTTAFDQEKVDKKQVGYKENLYQLCAYAQGLEFDRPKIANAYVSTSVPGLVFIKEWGSDDFDRGLRVFNLALQLWSEDKDYFPGVKNESDSI